MLPSSSVNCTSQSISYLYFVKLKLKLRSQVSNTMVDKAISFTFLYVRYLEYDVNGRIIFFVKFIYDLVGAAFYSALTGNFLKPSSWESFRIALSGSSVVFWWPGTASGRKRLVLIITVAKRTKEHLLLFIITGGTLWFVVRLMCSISRRELN